ADAAERVLARPIDEARGARLGEAVALEDQDAARVEELGDVARQRRGARDEVAHAAAEARLDLREHELVRDLQLEREEASRLASLLADLRTLAADAERPREDLLLGAAAGLHALEDLVVDLLEDTR